MAGADIARFSDDRRGQSANLALGVASGAFAGLADALLFPILLPVALVAALTDSYLALAAVPAIAGALWVVPQVVAAPVIRGRSRKLPWATGAALVRAATVALFAYVGYRADRLTDAQLLRAFFICYAAYVVAAGLAAALSDELVRRSLPIGRGDGPFRLRAVAGAVLGAAAGLTAARVLDDGGPTFPENFALLFVLAAVALGAAALLQALIREPVRLASPVGGTAIRPSVEAWLQALADPAFRRFLWVRLGLSAAAIADPFYVVYAARELGIELAAIGGYLAALVAARVLATPVWSALLRRRGSRTVLQVAGLVRLLVPLVAVLLPYLAETEMYRDRVTDERVTSALFGLTFVAYGAALAGLAAGGFSYLLSVAAPERRGDAFAVTNLALAAMALVPFAGAFLVERWGFETLFLVATLTTLAGIFSTGALPDSHVRVRTAAAAWRLRRARP
jgi:hypothetical protein